MRNRYLLEMVIWAVGGTYRERRACYLSLTLRDVHQTWFPPAVRAPPPGPCPELCGAGAAPEGALVDVFYVVLLFILT